MRKSMQALEIYTSDNGFICIKQESAFVEESIIIIHPDQLEVLIKWLRDEVINPNGENTDG